MSTPVCEGASSKHLCGHVNEQSAGVECISQVYMPPCEEATLQGMEVLVKGHVNESGGACEWVWACKRAEACKRPSGPC